MVEVAEQWLENKTKRQDQSYRTLGFDHYGGLGGDIRYSTTVLITKGIANTRAILNFNKTREGLRTHKITRAADPVTGAACSLLAQ